jgi:hypothetical protein
MQAPLLLLILTLRHASGEWTQLADAGWSPRSGFQMAVSGEDVVVAGGTNDPSTFFNDAYRLSLKDGKWYPLPFSSPQWPPRANFGMSVLHNGTIIMTGGQQQDGGTASLNDVWALDTPAADGAAWRKLPDAPWPHRVGHAQATCQSSDGEHVIIAGGVSSDAGIFMTQYQDVWSMSSDGAWRKLHDAPWHKRFLHNMVCLSGGRLVLTSGHSGFTDYNDVWMMSPDGSWSEVTSAAPFSTRGRFGMVAFPDDSVIVGEGMSKEDFWLGTVRGTEIAWQSLGKPPFSERYDYGMVALPSNGTKQARTALVAGGMLLSNGIHNYNNVYRLEVGDALVWEPLHV